MEIVFICSALRGDIEGNIAKANDYCRWAMVEHGVLPIAPHAYFTQFLDDHNEAERELGINAGLELLMGCSELWHFGDDITQGMEREINMANNLGLKVRHISNEEINLNNDWRNTNEIVF